MSLKKLQEKHPEKYGHLTYTRLIPKFVKCTHGQGFKTCSGLCSICDPGRVLRQAVEHYSNNADNELPYKDDDTTVAFTCGGNEYEAGIYRLCESIRLYQSSMLLYIFHRDSEKINEKLFSKFNVKIVNVGSSDNGWKSKAKGLELIPYRKVWFFDSDVYLFHPLPIVESSNRFYPNILWNGLGVNWKKFGVCGCKDNTIENDGGIWYVDRKQYKKECLQYINLTSFAGTAYDYYHDVYGDQGVWRVVHRWNNNAIYYEQKPYQRFDSVVHPSGFVHRYMNKLKPGCSSNPELPDDGITMKVWKQYNVERNAIAKSATTPD